MSHLISLVWPYAKDNPSYLQGEPHNSHSIKVLRIFLDDLDQVASDVSSHDTQRWVHARQADQQGLIELVVITRSWRVVDDARVAHYDVSQDDISLILEQQGLGHFYRLTRGVVAGVHTLSPSTEHDHNGEQADYFGLIYDSYLGFWARYDEETKWKGICILPDNSLDLQSIAQKLESLASNKAAMYLLAAQYTIDFLNVKSGELNGQVAKIERYSGHHFSVLRPVLATYRELEKVSAESTAIANLVSYYTIVVSRLADDMLSCCERGAPGQDERASREVEQQISSMKQRLRALSLYMMFLERRAERQVTATLHLVNAANASTNLAVAHDTKAIAVASKHDSSSMTILAYVATLFLPGTFVAALFSMTMFDWFASQGEAVVSSRFWVYWCITVPLTILVLGSWHLWEFWYLSRSGRKPPAPEVKGADDQAFA